MEVKDRIWQFLENKGGNGNVKKILKEKIILGYKISKHVGFILRGA